MLVPKLARRLAVAVALVVIGVLLPIEAHAKWQRSNAPAEAAPPVKRAPHGNKKKAAPPKRVFRHVGTRATQQPRRGTRGVHHAEPVRRTPRPGARA